MGLFAFAASENLHVSPSSELFPITLARGKIKRIFHRDKSRMYSELHLMKMDSFRHAKKIIGLAIVILVAPMLLLFTDQTLEKASNLGQAYGAVSALFSAAALFAVLITVKLQGSQLRVQIRELRESRHELRRTAEAQIKVHVALEKQAAAMEEQAAAMDLRTRLDAIQYRLIAYDWQLGIEWGPVERNGRTLQSNQFKQELVQEKQSRIRDLDRLVEEAFSDPSKR